MRPFQPLLAAAILIALPSVAQASQPKPTPDCAARDLKLLSQIEQHGQRQDVAGDKLFAAFLTMLDARSACAAGRTAEATALYDSAFGPLMMASPNLPSR
jgi:hypothetical protein